MVDRDLSRVSEGQTADSTSGDQLAGVLKANRRDAGQESCEAEGYGTEARWIASAFPRGSGLAPLTLGRLTGPVANPPPPDTADRLFAARATNSPRRGRSFSTETTASPGDTDGGGMVVEVRHRGCDHRPDAKAIPSAGVSLQYSSEMAPTGDQWGGVASAGKCRGGESCSG